jgi:N-methylhydantoinase A
MTDSIASLERVLPTADWKIGVDIGGTFMDFCALEIHSGRIASLKVLTTPDHPGADLATGLKLLQEREGIAPAAITRFVHGTTVGINTVIQRSGARLALFTTAGFEDVLEMARLRMPDMYSLFCHRAAPLISRDMVFGIPARMLADGTQQRTADPEAIAEAVNEARKRGAEGIVVALLHSWRNGAQETAIKAEILKQAPDLFVFTSSEIWPVIREFERSSTAILNSYVHPRVSAYLAALEKRLGDLGVTARPMLTKSNGGLMTANDGKRNCVNMLLSGTASGVIGAAWLARQAGEERILTLDIGGTSADFAIIANGQVQHGTGAMIGDFPLHIPSVSVSSIGIGGGSIASVDAQGILRVGPESAGSTPGPACYGRGGTNATVTDAMAVCGWIGQNELAYGQLTISPEQARKAVTMLADRLGRSVEEAAEAIIDIAVSEMFVELEKLAARSGVDLREYTLMPFGGGGPMLGAFLAREIGMSRVIAPRRPGVVSALGGLVADLRADFVRTIFAPLGPDALVVLRNAQDELLVEGRVWLNDQGHAGSSVMWTFADMRYAGQSHEIEVPLQPSWIADSNLDAITEAFHDMHRKLYAFNDPEARIELVNLRLSAIGDTPPVAIQAFPPREGPAMSERLVSIYTDGACRPTALFDRDGLRAGQSFFGPAVVVQEDTTLAVPEGATCYIDRHLNIHLTFEGSSNV